MLPFRYCLLVSLTLLTRLSWSQTTPFTATWNFDAFNASGSTSTTAVTAQAMQITNVNMSSVPATAYPAGQAGQGVNITGWNSTLCDPNEHVDFTITPGTDVQLTMTTLSLYFARSAQGPQQLSVRSSIDGFSADLFATLIVTETFQLASITLNDPGFTNQTGAVTFRVYACSPSDGRGALKLDEVKINGSVLPVELLYFRAQVVNDRVELAWATIWERNADRFIIERSRDLQEFGTLGSVSAKGTTDQTQRYAFSDPFPDGGTTYYRLRQVDFDGKTAYSKPVAVILDNQTPALALLGNPVEGYIIRVAARNLTGATFSLVTASGQLILLQSQTTAEGVLNLHSAQVMKPGRHWLQAEQGAQRLMKAVVVR